MSASKPFLTALFAGFIFLFAGGALGYFVFYEPMVEKKTAAAKLEVEAYDLEQKLAAQRKNVARLADVKKRSLPADEAIANREYYDVLYALLQQAKAPAASTVKPRAVDQKGVPLVTQNPKKPAYVRMAYDITMPKADLWALVNFLKAYYQLNLLQQITSIEIRRAEDVTSSGGKFTATDGSDRKDLNVKIVTEALILDGAEARRAVVPVSNAFAAVGGGPGYHAVAWTSGIGHKLKPQQFTPVLSTNSRDYFAMIAHDPFHGTLPKPPPPPKRVEPPPFVVAPPDPELEPKLDISPYINLDGIAFNYEQGSATASVRDRMNNKAYDVLITPKGVEVTRYVGTTGRRQPDPLFKPSKTLAISDPDSSTARQFRVVGVEFDALYLVDLNERPPWLGGFAAAVGGAIVVDPPRGNKLLRWPLGDSLKQLAPATPEESRRIFGGPEIAAR